MSTPKKFRLTAAEEKLLVKMYEDLGEILERVPTLSGDSEVKRAEEQLLDARLNVAKMICTRSPDFLRERRASQHKKKEGGA